MNFIVLLVTLFITLVLSLGEFAHSQEGGISRRDERCISTTADVVHDAIVNYRNYKNLDNGMTMPLHVEGFPTMNLPLVNMSRSEPVGFTRDPLTNNTDGHVQVWLTPITFGEEQRWYVPRFFLHCRSQWQVPGQAFTHSCDLETALNMPANTALETPSALELNFAINQFSSRLNVTTVTEANATARCPAGSARLVYNFTIRSQSQHVTVIQQQVVRNVTNGRFFSFLPEALRELMRSNEHRFVAALQASFDEDFFYPEYYSRFYNRFARSITPQD